MTSYNWSWPSVILKLNIHLLYVYLQQIVFINLIKGGTAKQERKEAAEHEWTCHIPSVWWMEKGQRLRNTARDGKHDYVSDAMVQFWFNCSSNLNLSEPDPGSDQGSEKLLDWTLSLVQCSEYRECAGPCDINEEHCWCGTGLSSTWHLNYLWDVNSWPPKSHTFPFFSQHHLMT